MIRYVVIIVTREPSSLFLNTTTTGRRAFNNNNQLCSDEARAKRASRAYDDYYNDYDNEPGHPPLDPPGAATLRGSGPEQRIGEPEDSEADGSWRTRRSDGT